MMKNTPIALPNMVNANRLRVAVPFVPFHIQLSHHVLDNIGQIAQFMLCALRCFPLSPSQIGEKIGLSHRQTDKIINRLCQFRLLTPAHTLTPLGHRLATAMQQDFYPNKKTVWVDALSGFPAHRLIVPAASAELWLTTHPKNSLVMPDRFLNAEKIAEQLSKVPAGGGDVFSALCQNLWPEMRTFFTEEKSTTDWWFEVSAVNHDTEDVRYFICELPLTELAGYATRKQAPEKKYQTEITLPVLVWHTQFHLPDGLPAQVPEPFYAEVCLVTKQRLEPTPDRVGDEAVNLADYGINLLQAASAFDPSWPPMPAYINRNTQLSGRLRCASIDPAGLRQQWIQQYPTLQRL